MAYVPSWARIAKKEGEKAKAVSMFMTLLIAKFGELPDWVKDKVEGADTAMIDAWLPNILNKDSLEDLFAI